MTAPQNIYQAKVAPEAISDAIGAGKRARQSGNREDALRYFTLAIEAAPALSEPKLEAATEMRALGRFEEAEALAHEVLAIAPGNVHAYNSLAFCARKRGQREQALKWFQAAIEAAPALPGPKLEAATEMRALGRFEEAEALAHEVLAIAPGNVHAYNSLAFCARKRGQREQALKWFQAAIEATPALPEPKLEAATEMRELGRFEEAEALAYEVLAIAPGNVHAYNSLAFCARKRGQREQALKWFQAAIEAAPALPGPKLEASTEMRELGHFDAAREMINRVLAEGGRPPYALIMLGLIERAANNREAALEAFTAAHKTDRRYARALVEMAIEHRQLGQQAACDQCLILALECDSRHIQAISQLAEQALMADKAEQALQLYSKAISDQPECTEFLFGQVTALARLGRIQDALSVLRHIEETLGPSTLLRIRQISLLRRIGKYYDALNLAREATTKEPFAFWLWAERVETELFVGEDADVEACLAAMRPSTLRERANFERLKGRWAESQLQLTAAIGHYENAAAILTQDPTIQHLLARSRIMAMDLERVQHHLRRVQDLRAPILRLRGESPNTSQTELGHLLNEFTLDFELCNKLTKLQSLPAVQRAAELSALVRIAPDNTAPAINLLIALRQSGALTVMPTGEERVIPRTIMQFWDEAAIPEDIRGLMVSWHSQNPDHNHQIFDNANALAWIEAYYPKSVALAYWRSREAAQKSDIFRLAWLARQGGIYADTDDLCLRSLDTMLPSGAKLVLSHEVLGTVGNNFIAVVPRHPVIELALQLAVHAVNRGDNDGVWYSTGPALLTRALTQILTASGTLNMDGTAILSMRELFRSVAVGCAASYKITRRHWSKAAKVRKTYCLPANIQQYRLHAPGVHADNLTVEHGEAAVILGD